MPILTAAQSRAILNKIVFPRDGKKCVRCGKKPVGKGKVKNPRREVERATLNHIDGVRTHNPKDGSNHNALCDSCQNTFPNRRKPKRRPHKFLKYKDLSGSLRVREKSRQREIEFERPPSPEMLKRRRAGKLLREFLRKYFKRQQGTYAVEAILGAVANDYAYRYDDEIKTTTLRDILVRVLCNEINGEYEIPNTEEIEILTRREKKHVPHSHL